MSFIPAIFQLYVGDVGGENNECKLADGVCFGLQTLWGYVVGFPFGIKSIQVELT
jgi:hypothetical protein